VHCTYDDFKSVVLRDVPQISEQDFEKLMEDIPWIEDRKGADARVDWEGIKPGASGAQEEYRKREVLRDQKIKRI
jgi:hypothetical protein